MKHYVTIKDRKRPKGNNMKKLLTITFLVAFYTGETVSGMNKICFYESPKGSHAITLDSYAVCPVSINV